MNREDCFKTEKNGEIDPQGLETTLEGETDSTGELLKRKTEP